MGSRNELQTTTTTTFADSDRIISPSGDTEPTTVPTSSSTTERRRFRHFRQGKRRPLTSKLFVSNSNLETPVSVASVSCNGGTTIGNGSAVLIDNGVGEQSNRKHDVVERTAAETAHGVAGVEEVANSDVISAAAAIPALPAIPESPVSVVVTDIDGVESTPVFDELETNVTECNDNSDTGEGENLVRLITRSARFKQRAFSSTRQREYITWTNTN